MELSRRRVQGASECNLAIAQEPEELDSLPKPALHHFRTSYHFTDDRSNLRCPEVESPIEVVDRLEDFGVTQMRVAQRRSLRAEVAQQSRLFIDEPAVCQRLLVKESARIGRGERDLDRVRVDLGGEADGFLDGFLGLAGQAEDEGAVDDNTELVAILGKPLRDVDAHALLDVVEDLLITGFVPDEEKPQPVVLHDLQGCTRDIGLGIARPDDPKLADFACQRLYAPQVVWD